MLPRRFPKIFQPNLGRDTEIRFTLTIVVNAPTDVLLYHTNQPAPPSDFLQGREQVSHSGMEELDGKVQKEGFEREEGKKEVII